MNDTSRARRPRRARDGALFQTRRHPGTLRVPEDLEAELDRISAGEGVSLQDVGLTMLRAGLREYARDRAEVPMTAEAPALLQLPDTTAGDVPLDHPVFLRGRRGGGPFRVEVRPVGPPRAHDEGGPR